MLTNQAVQVTTAGDREIVMTREFNAPARLVFEAYTRPELLKQWLHGPDGWTLTVCDVDLRVGGAYRYVWHNQDGRDMGMGGVYREIDPPARLIATEKFDEDWTGGEAVSTILFEERDGRTRMTNTMRYASPEARDGVLQSGMEHGLEASYARLDALVASLSPR